MDSRLYSDPPVSSILLNRVRCDIPSDPRTVADATARVPQRVSQRLGSELTERIVAEANVAGLGLPAVFAAPAAIPNNNDRIVKLAGDGNEVQVGCTTGCFAQSGRGGRLNPRHDRRYKLGERFDLGFAQISPP